MHPIMLRLVASGIVLGGTIGSAAAGDYDTLRVAGMSNFDGMIAGPANSGAMLSPDGARLFHVGTNQACLYNLTGPQPAQVICGKLPERMSGPEDMFWSPDDGHMVMPTYRDAFEAFRDTDIKVLDPTTLAITNLTDDGVDGSIMKRGPANMDAAAQWLDADMLIFLRLPFGTDGAKAREPASLMSIDLGGAPRELLKPISHGRGIAYALDVASDGTTVVYALEDRDNPDAAGIYFLDLANPAPKRITPMSEIRGLVAGLAFSADGKYFVVLGRDPKGYIAVTLVEVATGTATQLWPNLQIGGVAWSPAGSALAYLVSAEDGDSQLSGLYLAEPPSATGRLLKEGPFMPPFCCSQPVTWASNDTMVLGNIEEMDRPYFIRFAR